MSLTLPQDLAWALSQLGFDWPDSDEDKLNLMGQAWTNFAATLNGLIAEAEGHAQGVWTTNSARVCAIAAAAAKTPWTAAGAVAAVVIAKIAATMAINAAITLAIETLLRD
jgi:hypothetical protein